MARLRKQKNTQRTQSLIFEATCSEAHDASLKIVQHKNRKRVVRDDPQDACCTGVSGRRSTRKPTARLSPRRKAAASWDGGLHQSVFSRACPLIETPWGTANRISLL